MRPYTEIPDLREVVLENSWIRAIAASPGRVEFTLEAFLTERHPSYRPARPGEHGTYVDAVLSFARVERLTWEGQGARPATDASGEIDFGHIDVMTWQAGHFELDGEWGHMLVVAEIPDLEIA